MLQFVLLQPGTDMDLNEIICHESTKKKKKKSQNIDVEGN